ISQTLTGNPNNTLRLFGSASCVANTQPRQIDTKEESALTIKMCLLMRRTLITVVVFTLLLLLHWKN
ncbi:hypothetical protein ILYODFUR_034206, partial [Ilyodon furcidens]